MMKRLIMFGLWFLGLIRIVTGWSNNWMFEELFLARLHTERPIGFLFFKQSTISLHLFCREYISSKISREILLTSVDISNRFQVSMISLEIYYFALSAIFYINMILMKCIHYETWVPRFRSYIFTIFFSIGVFPSRYS